MFSVIFPGQGSQLVGMGKDLHDKHSLIQDLFKEADETLGFSLSTLILKWSKRRLRPNREHPARNIFNQPLNIQTY